MLLASFQTRDLVVQSLASLKESAIQSLASPEVSLATRIVVNAKLTMGLNHRRGRWRRQIRQR
jgi:hypothetical protein